MDSIDAIHQEPSTTASNMDDATLRLLAEKDQEIAKLTDENAVLKEELTRLRESSPTAHTGSPTWTLPTLTADSTPPAPSATAPKHHIVAWVKTTIEYLTSIIRPGPPPPSTYNETYTQQECEECESTLKQMWSSVGAFFTRLRTKLPAIPSYIFWKAQDPLDERTTEDYPWENNTTDSWDNAPPWQPDEPPKWKSLPLPPTTKSWLHGLHWKNPHATEPQRLRDIFYQHALVPATRLNDEGWLQSELGDVRVEDERLFRLATRGKEIGQKIIWDHADKNKPGYRNRHWPGGWQQVKMETNEIPSESFFEWRENDPHLAHRVLLQDVVPLRNLVCHWRHIHGFNSIRRVEMRLKWVQKFAITMGNEECAKEARLLRDELRDAVMDTVTELEQLKSTFNTCEFRYHHTEMFWQIEKANRDGELDKLRFPHVVLEAAEAWLLRGNQTSSSQMQNLRRFIGVEEQTQEHSNNHTDEQADKQSKDQTDEENHDYTAMETQEQTDEQANELTHEHSDQHTVEQADQKGSEQEEDQEDQEDQADFEHANFFRRNYFSARTPSPQGGGHFRSAPGSIK